MIVCACCGSLCCSVGAVGAVSVLASGVVVWVLSAVGVSSQAVNSSTIHDTIVSINFCIILKVLR